MIEDRDYMRQPVYKEHRVSLTVVLLIVNAIVFLVQSLTASNLPYGQEIQNIYFALSLEGLRHYYIWQLLTFQFMHAGWLHILFNSLVIFFFGRAVETVLGGARFLSLYFVSGIIGGVVQVLFTLATHSADAPVVGASAGASGLIAAFAAIYWTERFTLLFYFIPVTMRGKTLLWISIGLAVVGMLTPSNGIANAAHLGGILAGFFYTRQILHGHWPRWKFSLRRERPREFAATPAGKGKFWRAAARPTDDEIPTDQFLQKEVDPILDKISAHGIQSLTERERQILEKARAKMAKR
jgi:membrane associated rhomboid family serine protease